MKARKRKTIYRYWIVWKPTHSYSKGLQESIKTRPPRCQYSGEAYVVNLETGEVLQNTLTFRQSGVLVNRIDQNKWPKREKACKSLQAPKLRAERQAKKKAASRSPDKLLQRLQTQEKSWIRKLKLATTKLKKLRKRIKYYAQIREDLMET